ALTEAATAVEAEPPADPEPRRRLDLDFLDRIDGRLDVDLTVDVTLPVLGSRRKTHHFRVPIAKGTINYKDLEGDLAKLEDAFIDIEVRGRQLAIERRIPLIPGSEKPLVLFDLEPDEVAMAHERLVRLATLGTLRLPPRSDEGRSSVQLRELDFGNVDVALEVAPPPAGAPVDASWNASGNLALQGELRFAPGKTLE